MKDYDQDKESLYLKYWDVHTLYGWALSQMLPVNDFKWVEHTFEFDKTFTNCSNEESNDEHFLDADTQYLESFRNLIIAITMI